MPIYRHFLDGHPSNLPTGKVVCVGRNYVDHVRELNNEIPDSPVLFLKPSTSLVNIHEPLHIPVHFGECHFETEMSLLIGKKLSNCSLEDAETGIIGIGLSLDLTLRDLQTKLKRSGLPWEKAKAFDGSCPTSNFVSRPLCGDLNHQQIVLYQNNCLMQNDNSSKMLMPAAELVKYITSFFTLLPGDIVLTGTPSGVGPLNFGDTLRVSLSKLISCKTVIQHAQEDNN
jgi:2-keto-4-pentenoate hydratase/2-oxohepta-3-ene-1,7-dioic acid hydratase in catechol pathway